MAIRPPPIPANPYNVFYKLTGVGFFALVSGFSVCLFDITQVSACVDYSTHAVDIFKGLGDHIIAWAEAMYKEISYRYQFRR